MAKRILIVDDDPNIRRIVTLALTDDSHYIVSDVSSAEAALLHIARQPVDLLFTDIRMPGMSGLDLVQRVHELDPNTAIIVFTVSPEDLDAKRAADLKVDCLLEKPVAPERLRMAVDLLLDPLKLLPRPSQRAQSTSAPARTQFSAPSSVLPPVANVVVAAPASNGAASPTANGGAMSGPLGQRLAQLRSKKQTGSLESTSVAMRLTSSRPGVAGRAYSDTQIEQMRQALKELALEPDVHCAVLADMSGMVLTHWSRRRDINVTVVAALAVGNTLAMAEISRNLGQQRPGHLVIQEGQDQSIIMASMHELMLLIAIGPNASLGWARIATLRACEEVVRIAASD